MIKVMSIVCLSVVMTGCANKPTVNDASNYLKIEAELIKINSIKDTLLAQREELTKLVSFIDITDIQEPSSRADELSSYLADNDCLINPDFGYCYQLSRIRLIHTTKELESVEYINYVQLLTINRLIKNINSILDSLASAKAELTLER